MRNTVKMRQKFTMIIYVIADAKFFAKDGRAGPSGGLDRLR
jgi:hypothetical protein